VVVSLGAPHIEEYAVEEVKDLETETGDTESWFSDDMTSTLSGSPSICAENAQAEARSKRSEAEAAAYQAKTIAQQLDTERIARKQRRRKCADGSIPVFARTHGSSSTVGPGQTAEMIFDFGPDACQYNEDQLAMLATVQPDGSAIIKSVLEPLSATIEGHVGVLPGDKIYVPGGTLHQLATAFGMGGRYTLLVCTRPDFFECELRCEGEHWHYFGMQATIDRQRADRLNVQAVRDYGLVPEWNRNNPLTQVVPGDSITHVNGEAKGAHDLASAIASVSPGDVLRLCIYTRPRIAAPSQGSKLKSSKSRVPVRS
jgi:hypothetical protein